MSKIETKRRARMFEVAHGDECTGTRSVERALRLLRELSSRGEFGWRLSDLAEQVELDRGTCHRLLACFVKEGFAQRHADDLKYYPGQLLFEMGLVFPRFEALRELVNPRLHHLAMRTRCIASFSLRSGNDAVCVFQQRAGLDIAAMLIKVGSRRPLVTCVAGLAMLQHLPPDERQRVLEDNHRREAARGGERRIENLERMRRRSEERGFGFTLGDIAPGLAALAVPIPDADGNTFAALTLTGTDKTVNERNAGEFHAIAASTADDIAQQARRHLR